MLREFYLIQHVKDIFRQEGRNIGVVLQLDDTALFHALGQVDRQTTDPEPFLTMTRQSTATGWFYQEWINWFHTVTENENQDQLKRVLLGLDEQGSPFVVKTGGWIEVDPKDSPERILRGLFAKLVGTRAVSTRGEFESRVEAVKTKLNLLMQPGFEENVELEFQPEGKPHITVRLPLLLAPETGPKTVFKFVRTRTSTEAFFRQANDAAFVFNLAVEHGFTTKERCIVLTEPATAPEKQAQLAFLASIAHVISLADTGAIKELTKIIWPTTTS